MKLLFFIAFALVIEGSSAYLEVRRLLLEEKEQEGTYQVLHDASSSGNVTEVVRLLDSGVSPDVASPDGISPLMVAALNNRRSVINLLFSYGCNVEAQTSEGATALWLAAEAGNADMVKVIAENGRGTVDSLNNQGLSPLHIASKNGRYKVASVLVSMGANVNLVGGKPRVTPLCEAAASGHVNIMELLLQSGAYISGGNRSTSPLGMAAMTGGLQAIKFLMQNGADINQKDTWDGSTPLHMASRGCRLGVTVWLLDKGANADVKDQRGNTPEDLVCSGDLADIRPHEVIVRSNRLLEVLSTAVVEGEQDVLSPAEATGRLSTVRSAHDEDRKPGAREVSAPTGTSCFFGNCASPEKPEVDLSSIDLKTMEKGRSFTGTKRSKGTTLALVVASAVGLALLGIIVYLFGVRKVYSPPSEEEMVAELESNEKVQGGVNASVLVLSNLPKDTGRTEMDRLANTPLADMPEDPPKSGRMSPSAVPPLRIKGMKTRRKRSSRSASKRQHNARRMSPHAECSDLEGLKRAGLAGLMASGSDPPNSSVERNSRKALLALHRAQQHHHDINRRIEEARSPPLESGGETACIYHDNHVHPQGVMCQVVRNENPLYKDMNGQEPVNDFDSLTDHSDTGFDTLNDRRLSLTGSF